MTSEFCHESILAMLYHYMVVCVIVPTRKGALVDDA
jgi:hypothetical protein